MISTPKISKMVKILVVDRFDGVKVTQISCNGGILSYFLNPKWDLFDVLITFGKSKSNYADIDTDMLNDLIDSFISK